MFARTFFPLSLTTNPILFHQLRNITKNSLHPLSIFRSKRESERSYRNEEENIIPIYIHVSPPLFEYIGFEFWVWVNSMKTRPNRGTVCKLPIASFPQVFRAPVSDKYSTKDTLPLLLPPPLLRVHARSRLRSGYIARVSIESLSKTLKYQPRAAGFSGIELPGNTIAVDAIRLYFCDY